MTEKEVLEKFDIYGNAIKKLKDKVAVLNSEKEANSSLCFELNNELSRLNKEYSSFKEKTLNTIKYLVEGVIEPKERVASESSQDEISVLEETIAQLKMAIVEKDRVIKEKSDEIDKLRAKDEIRIDSVNDDEYFRFKFGRTTKSVMNKVIDFVDLLFEGVKNQETEKILLNNPEKCSKKLDLTNKEFEVFMTRLQNIKVNSKPLFEYIGKNFYANFKDDWIKQYITKISN